jgi:DNA-binding response OmpR family regulator
LSDALTNLLNEEGYQIRTYPNDEAAYQSLKDCLPSLILLELRYIAPNWGRLTLDRLHFDPATVTIPVIVCTGDSVTLQHQTDHLNRLGVIVQEKPFLIDDLLDKMAHALGSRTALAA